jgi:hypothetical protein
MNNYTAPQIQWIQEFERHTGLEFLGHPDLKTFSERAYYNIALYEDGAQEIAGRLDESLEALQESEATK